MIAESEWVPGGLLSSSFYFCKYLKIFIVEKKKKERKQAKPNQNKRKPALEIRQNAPERGVVFSSGLSSVALRKSLLKLLLVSGTLLCTQHLTSSPEQGGIIPMFWK